MQQVDQFMRAERCIPRTVKDYPAVERTCLEAMGKYDPVSVRVSDIDAARNIIHIRQSKGAKDRDIPLSKKAHEQLRIYLKLYKPTDYLFEGQFGGMYSESSIQGLFRRALKEIEIRKKGTVHTSLYSYATHLLESETDFNIFQEWTSVMGRPQK